MSLLNVDLKPVIKLIRIANLSHCGMLGNWIINDQPFCLTLEPPDRENQANISCIPEGQYHCVRYKSPRFARELFRVLDVPFRTDITIHSGKTVKHTEGCILLGQHWDKLLSYDRVLANSGHSLNNFMEVMKDINSFHLTIRNSF